MDWATVLAGRSLGFGLLVWLVPFVSAFPVFPVKAKTPLVFKALMGVILGVATVILARIYCGGAPRLGAGEAVAVGVLWMLLCIAIDLPLFTRIFGMKTTTYLSEIGLSYLVVPVIVWGVAGRS